MCTARALIPPPDAVHDQATFLKRSDLPAVTVRYLKHGRGWGCDLRLLRVVGTEIVLKDFGYRPPLVKLVGRFLIWRETAAYRQLGCLPGVPRFFGRFGAYGLLYEYVPGRLGNEFEPGELPESFFARLSYLVGRIHERGIAHGDLKRRTNILVCGGEPVLIDFAASIHRGSEWNPFARWLFHQLCCVDRNGIAKLKRRLAPELLSEAERRAFEHPTLLERLARTLLGR